MELRGRIEHYLRRSGMSATRLGREAMGDPRFVHDLRKGREPRPATAARLIAWMNGREEKKAERAG